MTLMNGLQHQSSEKTPLTKLALGTAQLGLNYGVANKAGKVPQQEAREILAFAIEKGIDTIDTAVAYGDSEKVLGSLGVSDFRVVTKLGGISARSLKIRDKVQAEVEGSLERLSVSSLYGLLLHNPADLLSENGEALAATLIELKNTGLVCKVGVSVYEPQELRRVMQVMSPDLVQLPLNLVDRRFEREGLLNELHDRGVEIHARSAFLQGLLLMSLENLPKKFQRWHEIFKAWEVAKQQIPVSAIALCLAYPLSLEEVDRVVVGVDSLRQLSELLEAQRNETPTIDLSFLESNDPVLINPSKWNTL
jgi:aryl-alcohol dehydrogenase-like predicted oxidoreductase